MIKLFKVTTPQASEECALYVEHLADLEALLSDDEKRPGDSYTIEVVEMTDVDVAALPEWDGWS